MTGTWNRKGYWAIWEKSQELGLPVHYRNDLTHVDKAVLHAPGAPKQFAWFVDNNSTQICFPDYGDSSLTTIEYYKKNCSDTLYFWYDGNTLKSVTVDEAIELFIDRSKSPDLENDPRFNPTIHRYIETLRKLRRKRDEYAFRLTTFARLLDGRDDFYTCRDCGEVEAECTCQKLNIKCAVCLRPFKMSVVKPGPHCTLCNNDASFGPIEHWEKAIDKINPNSYYRFRHVFRISYMPGEEKYLLVYNSVSEKQTSAVAAYLNRWIRTNDSYIWYPPGVVQFVSMDLSSFCYLTKQPYPVAEIEE